MTINIRRARVSDANALPAIETCAARLFLRDPQLAWLAEAPVLDAEGHRRNIQRLPVWVACPAEDQPCAFLCAEPLGHELHIWEISVASDYQGQGIGKALLQAAIEHARQQRLKALTLTTFRQLPWNEPFYQRQGFITLDAGQLGTRLEQVLLDEQQHGLPALRRCAMRLLL
ncbi:MULTISPECIES: GNAT family N-acetyltransferase [unclassified Pseudomonas]|uniref:GNAT family N-acetyltransferase n=1 Tax=unclassified Pseudomonas TaxID=196821 RepID=UPI0008386C00|nr:MULTISPECIES: GNAT family N-acetyltransferase [unclassified Pseudomonas]QIH07980.1 GNAT family N-acetyltransferase [Pseudomonas sp. BIOMIG1BAC]